MDTLEVLQNTFKRLSIVRKDIEAHTYTIDTLKNERDALQHQLLELMKNNNLKAWKTQEHSYSIISKLDVRISDEDILMQDIQSRKLDGLIYAKVDTLKFKQLANMMLKQTWEVFDGTEAVQSEYISIRTIAP